MSSRLFWEPRNAREVKISITADGAPTRRGHEPLSKGNAIQKLREEMNGVYHYHVQLVIELRGFQLGDEAIGILQRVQLQDKIHSMTLRDCNVTGSNALSFVAQCKNLHIIELSRCTGLADAHVTTLAQCRSLHTLDLTGCTGLTDVATLGQCKKLHTLHLARCIGLTDVTGLERCKKLHTLQLTSCTGLTGCTQVMAVYHPMSLHETDIIYTRLFPSSFVFPTHAGCSPSLFCHPG